MCGLMSPSIRREWIEMMSCGLSNNLQDGLPPYGGSGLKCLWHPTQPQSGMSPSIRREWIEIGVICGHVFDRYVSLHTEGVD